MVDDEENAGDGSLVFDCTQLAVVVGIVVDEDKDDSMRLVIIIIIIEISRALLIVVLDAKKGRAAGSIFKA